MESKTKKRRGRPSEDKRAITFTVDRSVYEAFHRFPQGRRSSYANQWLKKAFVEKTNILLYEDPAGTFFWHQEGSSIVYQDIHHDAESSFILSAEAIRGGRTADWPPELIYSHTEMQAFLEDPETIHIATYLPDGTIRTYHQPRMMALQQFEPS